jgi:TolB-like protein
MIRTFLLILGLGLPYCLPTSLWAAANYEESLKQLAEGVIAEAIKAKKQRLAFLDFTDSKGNATPLGQFLADEVGTQVLVAGELKVVERTLVLSTLKKLHVDQIEPAQAKSVRRAAKAIRADVFIAGSYMETPEGVLVTAKLISPLNVQVVGAARGTLPKTGPLGVFIKEANKPPVVKIEGPKEPPIPAGLGFHRNEYYELVVQSIEKQDGRAKLDLTIENRSSRNLKVLCLLQETMLKDDHGAAWHQGVEENRDGLCTRGLELSPREKERAVLTFTAPSDASASLFTLHYHEKSPRRDADFTIDGLKVESGVVAAPGNP